MSSRSNFIEFYFSGIIMHELMHAAGFWHEQSRADRDDYISINWSNIQAGMEFNFLKYDLRKIDHLGAEYDTCSVMHYGAYAFAKVSYAAAKFYHLCSCPMSIRTL